MKEMKIKQYSIGDSKSFFAKMHYLIRQCTSFNVIDESGNRVLSVDCESEEMTVVYRDVMSIRCDYLSFSCYEKTKELGILFYYPRSHYDFEVSRFKDSEPCICSLSIEWSTPFQIVV